MSWKKKKKEMKKVKHKAKIIIGLMFAVVIGLIILLGYKIIHNQNNYYKIDSRVEKLKKEKPIDETEYKAIGWLRVQGTNLDVPILNSPNMYESFPVELEDFGWSDDKFDKDSTYYDITGHNIFNLSAHPKIKSNRFHRFEALMAFVYYDFAKKNEYIQLTIDDEDYLYKIFAVGFMDASKDAFLPLSDKPNKEGIENTIKLFKNNTLYNYDTNVNADDKIISLSTCTRFYGTNVNVKLYVAGRMLREGEKINHYKVTKNKKYGEVEKILKGDENDGKDKI